MNSYSLTDLGGGVFELNGRLDLSNVPEALTEGQEKFNSHDDISIDLAPSDCVGSAGMALLLEWSVWCSANGKCLSYRNAPSKLIGLAKLNDVEQLVHLSANLYRSRAPLICNLFRPSGN